MRVFGDMANKAPVADSMVLDCMLAKVKHAGEEKAEGFLLRAYREVVNKNSRVKMSAKSHHPGGREADCIGFQYDPIVFVTSACQSIVLYIFDMCLLSCKRLTQ